MARTFPPLTPRQVEVLQWISDGCPDGIWNDFTYKRTSYALAERGLAEVDRRRGSWSARMTPAGNHYLSQGSYRTASATTTARTTKAQPAPEAGRESTRSARYDVDPAELIAELQRVDGALTVPDPVASVRAGYRSALSRAVNDRLVPDGYRLTYKGRDRGDLVVRLIAHDNEPPSAALLPIHVPADLRGAPDAVIQITKAHELLAVSAELRSRAGCILTGIAAECSNRGWSAHSLSSDAKSSSNPANHAHSRPSRRPNCCSVRVYSARSPRYLSETPTRLVCAMASHG